MELDRKGLRLETELSPEGILIVRLCGDIDLTECPALRKALYELVDNGNPWLVLDMTDVPYVDSAGMGILIGVMRRVRERGGLLEMTGVNASVRRAFELTRLDRLFHLQATVLAALEAIRERSIIGGIGKREE